MSAEGALARGRFNSLGIPVDDLTLGEACTNILRMIDAGRQDRRARYVATVNVDFLVNAVGRSARQPRHPELLEVLRSAELVTADGFPVVWLSRLLRRPIRERVTGADLVPALAREAARYGASLFLLGGADGVAVAAGRCLQAAAPGLRIAGAEAPMIHVQGAGLADSLAADEALVERINASGADVLLLGLGNPKQELWFHRNRHRLTVPVSIGVGGTFTFLTGRVRRAPGWAQRWNLEWVYRISQDPVRLWRRYARGLFELALMVLPLVGLRLREALGRPLGRSPNAAARIRTLWSSRSEVLQLVRLPRTISRSTVEELLGQLDRGTADALTIVDFSAVRRLPIASFQAMFELVRRFDEGRSEGFVTGLRRPVERALRAGRIVDVVNRHHRPRSDTLAATAGHGGLGCRTYSMDHVQLICLGGRLSAEALAGMGLDLCVSSARARRPCVLDVRRVTGLDIGAAVRLAELAADGPAQPLLIAGAKPEFRRTFRLAGLRAPRSVADERLLCLIFEAGDRS